MITAVIRLKVIANPEQPNQHSLARLFVVVGLISLALASGQWAIQSSIWDSTEFIPWFFCSIHSNMATGLFLAHFTCLVMIIAIKVLIVRSNPRPFTPIFFLGLVPFVAFIDDSATARYLLVLLLASVMVLVEPSIRQLDPKWRVVAALCFATTFGYYWMIICVLASAAV